MRKITFNYYKRLVLLFVSVILLGPLLVVASTIVRTGGSIGVAQDQVVEGDFYVLGDNLTLSGKVTEDILAAAARVIINGEVGGDALVVGATVDINGLVKDDVRVVGTAVSIAGEVSGNVVVVAQSLKILSTANIEGDVLFYGGNAEIAGVIGRDLLGRSESIRLDGSIAGLVDVRSGQVTLGDRANIEGSLRYESARELVRSPNAIVASVTRSDIEDGDQGSFAGFLMVFLITLFASLVFYLIMPAFLRRISGQVLDHPLRSALIGTGTFFIVPIASIALFVSTLGVVVGGVLVSAFISVLVSAYAAAGVVTGAFIARFLRKPDEVSIVWIVVGNFFLLMLVTVPIVGATLVFGTLIITLGALVETVIRQLRNA